MKKFSQSVIEKLRYYVYYLANPDTGKVFYIGKGLGNRVYNHAREVEKEIINSSKQKIIADIVNSGRDVNHVIIRHGLTEKEAFEVEAALIDFVELKNLPGNLVMGHQSDDRGKMTDYDVIEKYSAQEKEIQEPSILININRTYQYGMTDDELYKITRGNWPVNPKRHNPQPQLAFAVYRGLIKQIYRIQDWSLISQGKDKGRWQFSGAKATQAISGKYIPGKVEKHFAKGAQFPIKYVNC